MGTLESQTLCGNMVEEIDPSVRYCEHQIKRAGGGPDDTNELLALAESGRSGSASLGMDMLQVCRQGGRDGWVGGWVRRASLGGLWDARGMGSKSELLALAESGRSGSASLGMDMLQVGGWGSEGNSGRVWGACGREWGMG